MKLAGKLFLWLFSLILIACFGATLWLRSLDTKTVNTYVSQTLTTISKQPTEIKGPIIWQLFPHPGINITDIAIGPSIKIKQLFVKLNSLSLLRGQINLNKVTVDGLNVVIDTQKPIQSKPKKSLAKVKTAEETKQPIVIEKILLSHGKIHIKNKQDRVILSDLQLSANQVDLSKPFFIHAKSNLVYLKDKQTLAKGMLELIGKTQLPLDIPRFQGSVTMTQATLGQLNLQKIAGQIDLNPKTLTLNPLKINLYKGLLVSSIKYRLTDGNLSFNQTATNLNSAKLMQDLFKQSLIKGKLDFSMRAQANIRDPDWVNKLQGKGIISVNDGSIEAINFPKIIQAISNKVNHLLHSKDATPEEPRLKQAFFSNPAFYEGNTPFKLLTLPYELKDGNLLSNSAMLQTEMLELKGQGQINLLDQSINSIVEATVIIPKGKLLKIQRLLGGNFPLKIKGTLTDPDVLPDLKKINPIVTKLWIKAQLKPIRSLTKQLTAPFRRRPR